MAKTEKDLSDPRKLGFMRFVEVIFIIHIVFTISYLVLLHKGTWDLDFDSWLELLDLIFEGITLWLLWLRKQYTRQIVIGFALFNILIGTGYNLVTGVFDLTTQLLNISWDVVLIVYFATSRRAKAILVQPFSMESAQAQLESERGIFRLRTFAFWRNLIIYFCVFAVVGHWMEAALCTLIKLGIVEGTYDPNSQIWSDYLYPFPVYGIGFCACVLLLFPLKTWLQEHVPSKWAPFVLSLLINTAVCAAIELGLGLATNQPGPDGKLPLWDYSDMPFNFMGQICLQNTSAFGVIATLMTWVVYPALEQLIAKVPRDAMNMVFVGVVLGYVVLTFLYYLNVDLPDLEALLDTSDDVDAASAAADATSTAASGDAASASSAG